MGCRLKPAAVDYLARFDTILEQMEREMTGAELTNSISHNFIVQMLPHHRAAIAMSQNILTDTCWTPLRRIAQTIICEQTQSIEQMRKILNAGSLTENTVCQVRASQRRMRQIFERMFCRMENAPRSNCLNNVFLRQMIPHHEGAIAMAQNTLCDTISPALVPVLRDILRTQERGVAQMRALLRAC